MNSIVVGVLTFVAMSSASIGMYPRGCIYIHGRCYKECPEGTHGYTRDCGVATPEPTCTELNPVEDEYEICDYSACYCDPPTIRDTKTGKCVLMEDCSEPDSPAVPTPTLHPTPSGSDAAVDGSEDPAPESPAAFSSSKSPEKRVAF